MASIGISAALGSRSDVALIKVVGVGLGRTGTSSLHAALEMLGFGPCYHMLVRLKEGQNDFALWNQIGEEPRESVSKSCDELLRGWVSVLDYSAAINADRLYAAYPDAKFILTTRDPVKWEKSMKATLLHAYQSLQERSNRTQDQEDLMNWVTRYVMDKYHHGRLMTHMHQELLDHDAYIKSLIPPEKLLVYEVGEGWERLAAFLGVPIPTKPFPHVNDATQFLEAMSTTLGIDNESEGVRK